MSDFTRFNKFNRKSYLVNGQTEKSVEYLAMRIGIPIENWYANKRKVCAKLSELYFQGEIITGVYTGVVNCIGSDTAYSYRVVPHCWIQLADGNICDPVRWFLHKVSPYVFVGKSEDYDRNGEQTKKTYIGQDGTPNAYDPTLLSPNLSGMSDSLKEVITFLLYGSEKVDINQLRWLCSIPPSEFYGDASEFFEIVYELGYMRFFNKEYWADYIPKEE